MFDETIHQKTKDGIYFPELLSKRGIIPGIKVDQGREEVTDSPGEYLTKGLKGLSGRLKEYLKLGARFTKWRAVYVIGEKTPTSRVVTENAKRLAEFARVSQTFGLVPIVEPEVLMQGSHDIKKSEEVTYLVLKRVFSELSGAGVFFEGMLLKPNWVHPGKDFKPKPKDQEVAKATLKVLKEVVPPEVPGIVFLSGGDSPEDSTRHLDAMNELDNVPWELSFSFGRALQQPVLKIWAGKEENIKKAQTVFYKRARLNSLARTGDYKKEMENG
jgi:fructose-bisphosphate aldolase class I